jgi:hypothetical protein
MTMDTSPTPVDGEDILIAERLLKAFYAAKEFERTNSPADLVPREGIWEMMKYEFHPEFDRVLLAKDPTDLAVHLSNAFRLPTTHGLGPGRMVFEAAQNPNSADEFAATILDRIVIAAEALGVLPYENPEQGRYGDNVYENIGDVLDGLEAELGTPLGLPPIMGRFGLRVGHRIVDVRTADSAYVAWRIRTLLGKLNDCRVCEIGAGLARTAQLCSRIGVQQYTIFDLPVINVLQGYFLIKTCGKERVQLFGEEGANPPIRVFPYWKLFEAPEGYFDLCLNQDSLPEIPGHIARKYIAEMPRIARLFLSINQEGGGPTGTEGMTQLIVPKLVDSNPGFRRIARHPYWVRRGYVEETYRLSN